MSYDYSGPENFDEAMGALAAAQQELQVYGEILANVLHVTGPVTLRKGDVPDPNLILDVNFDPKGEFAVVRLAETGD